MICSAASAVLEAVHLALVVASPVGLRGRRAFPGEVFPEADSPVGESAPVAVVPQLPVNRPISMLRPR